MSKKYQFVFTIEAESFDDAQNIAGLLLIENPEVEGFRLQQEPKVIVGTALKVAHLPSDFPKDENGESDRTAADYADAPATNYEQGFED